MELVETIANIDGLGGNSHNLLQYHIILCLYLELA